MPEAGGSNIEMAHHLTEHNGPPRSLVHQVTEIAEAVVLAAVAIATAWSGYQAALWTGHQSELYSQSSELRVEAEEAAVYANQERLYNASTVAEWLKAEAHGESKLAGIFERRFLPEFLPAFEAWKKTDPIHNAGAPPGPFFMREYHSTKMEEAAKLNAQAAKTFGEGNLARRHSDDYVLVTVFLATVLLLTAIGQRFKLHGVRIGLGIVALVLLCLQVFRILTLPRA
jgi:hypothetical protein